MSVHLWSKVVLDICVFMCLFSDVVAVSSCSAVTEVYKKQLGGLPEDVPLSPIPAVLTTCSHTSEPSTVSSCCSSAMENKFSQSAQDYLRDSIKRSNRQLKERINQSLAAFQEHLNLTIRETQAKISDALTMSYNIPKEEHTKVLDVFFGNIRMYLFGDSHHVIGDIIDRFFRNLFPLVFDYVIIDPSRSKQMGQNFHGSLVLHYSAIQPFGNVPTYLAKKLNYAFQRARVFSETLRVMRMTVDAANNVTVDEACQNAVARLQFCSMCGGHTEVRPCRGLCLNVMRGCLAKISELSPSWDELVMNFQNLQMGMFKQHNAQELLSYLDRNITDALLQASEDGPRIYKDVINRCKDYTANVGDTKMVFKKFPSTPITRAPHLSSRVHTIRSDINALVKELDDSKIFLQRLADGLCRSPSVYDQEMQSDVCWNGSTVAKYMHSVTEASMISQVNNNPEVKVTMIQDLAVMGVKDVLIHMCRNLTTLMNEELMLNDQSYIDATGSGGGYGSTGRDVNIIDDEDFEGGMSGNGSGSGSEEDPTDTQTNTISTAPIPFTPSRAPSGVTTPKNKVPKDSAGQMIVPFTWLLICAAVWCGLCNAL